jgi:hypothetical protein
MVPGPTSDILPERVSPAFIKVASLRDRNGIRNFSVKSQLLTINS